MSELKQDIQARFTYDVDENIHFLDLTRNLILLESVWGDEAIRRSQELRIHSNHIQMSSPQISKEQFTTFDSHSAVVIATAPARNTGQEQQNSTSSTVPDFHKELLREYKHSVSELKKQNEIIRTIISDNLSPPHKQQQQSSQLKSKVDEQPRREEDNYATRTRRNLNEGERRRRASDEDDHRLRTYDTINISQELTERRKKKGLSDRYFSDRHNTAVAVSRPSNEAHAKSAKLTAERARKDLEDLQALREKEISRLRIIEKAIKRREHQDDKLKKERKIHQQKQLQHQRDDRRSLDSDVSAACGSKSVQERRCIDKLNEQISSLDQEIKSITTFIQTCIQSES